MLLTPQILKLRDDCLVTGVKEREFWDMTIGEAVRACDAFEERRKDVAYFSYTTASAVGWFIGSMFGSGAPPTLSDIYPTLHPKEAEQQTEEEPQEDVIMDKSTVNFMKFAQSFNQRFKENGNRES